MALSKEHIEVGGKLFFRELGRFLFNPVFIVITFLGNGILIGGAFLFWHFEYGENPQLQYFLDSLYWALITITTVGYGDITPVTIPGKILAMAMIVTGTGLFLCYVALLTSAFVNIEVDHIEKEVTDLRRRIKKMGD